jgi:hypothetical protein
MMYAKRRFFVHAVHQLFPSHAAIAQAAHRRVAATMILAQVAVHRTADPAFECPKRHGAGVLGVEPLLVVHAPRAVQPKLGDGDQGGIVSELRGPLVFGGSLVRFELRLGIRNFDTCDPPRQFLA